MASFSHLLLLLTLFGRLPNLTYSADGDDGPVPKDTYVCEKDEVVTLQCPNNDNINVKKVLYGRQRMDKCNDNKRRLPSDCYSQSATSIVMRLCENKTECSFTAARFFDIESRIIANLTPNGRRRCTRGRGRSVASILYVCRAPPKPTSAPTTRPTPAWHIETTPRKGLVTVVSGSSVKLSCLVNFTDNEADTNKIVIRWTDFQNGNLLYSSLNPTPLDNRMKVNVVRERKRIRSTLVITNVTIARDSDHRILDCIFAQVNVNSINSRLRVEITPPTPSPSPPTTIPTTMPVVEPEKPPRKKWTRRRCQAAEQEGYKLCQPESKCFDFGASIICRCGEGFTGSGLIPGACEKLPESIRLHSPGSPWQCPKDVPKNPACISKDLKDIQDKVEGMDLKGKLETFRNFTQKKDLTVNELLAVGRMMQDTVKKVVQSSKDGPVTPVFPQIVVRSTSNLLSRRDLWKKMPSQRTRRTLATSFTKMVTDTCMASTAGAERPLVIDDSLIDVKVVPVTSKSKLLHFQPGSSTGDTIKLELRSVKSSKDQPRVVFTRFKAIGDDFTSQEGSASGGNKSAPKLRVLSDVVAATASSAGLVKKIAFRLVHPNVKEIVNGTPAQRRCAYWNEENLTWAYDGCRIANRSDPLFTTCECDHLTSFAVLLDFGNATAGFAQVHQLSLSIITYVGCCLSIFCCIFGVWTYDILRRSKGDRMNSEGRTSFFIYEMICFSLLVAQTIFLMGIFHTSTLVLCRLVAALLHYFFLLLFEWMLVAGVYYILVYTQPYSIATVDTHRGWLVLIIFLAPAIIVGVSMGLRLEGYGTNTHCWLSVADGLIWAFVGPVTAMLSINMILLAVLIVLTWRIKPSEMLETGEVNKTWVTTRALKLRYELLFCIVLGATWIFGYFLIENTSSLVFSYIFAILNSLQGVFILISYANWSRIRAAYIAEFRRKRWLPESFRRWLHSRQYSPGGPPGVGLAGSSGTPSQRRTGSRTSGSQRGLLTASGGPHGSDSAQLSRTTRSTRLGSGSSQPQKWSVSAGSPHGLDANDNSVAMVTETEAAFNENYLGHSMMDEPRQTYVDFDERFVSQSDAEIINMTAALPLREHEEDGEHQHHYDSSSTSSSSSVASVRSTPPSSFSGQPVASPHDSLAREPPKLPIVCAVPSPFTGGTPAKESAAQPSQLPAQLPTQHNQQLPPQHNQHTLPPQHNQQLPPQHNQHTLPPQHNHQMPPQHTQHTLPPQHNHQMPPQHTQHTLPPQHNHQMPPQHTQHTLPPQHNHQLPPQHHPHHFTPVLGSSTVPRPIAGYPEEVENDYLVPNTGSPTAPTAPTAAAPFRHTLDCRGARRREDAEVRASVSAKQKRFSQSDLYANADDVVYYSQPPLEPSLPPDHPRQGPSRVTNV